MLYLVSLLILAALILFWVSAQQRNRAGIPAGHIIYSDMNRWSKTEKPLYDPLLRLTGKPDYLVDQGNLYIPVEVKSCRVRQAPYDSHIFQLAAYCLLCERVLGRRPTYGILHYSNGTYGIDYTPQLETALMEVMDDMRQLENRRTTDRSHESASRCRRCGYRNVCDQAIK